MSWREVPADSGAGAAVARFTPLHRVAWRAKLGVQPGVRREIDKSLKINEIRSAVAARIASPCGRASQAVKFRFP